MRASHSAAGVILGAAMFLTVPAVAQTEPPPPQQQQDQKLVEARQRYERGLQLFNESNYEAARVEFERAYQLAPSYKILYNIGLCYEQLGDYVQAQTTLQRYLEQGGSEVSEERRSEVAKELAQIRPRIARVTIHTNVPGAEVLVDDACSVDAASGNVNCGALDGTQRVILMNPGRRRVTLRHDGYLPETQLLTLAGSDQTDVTVTLKQLAKNVAEKKSNPFVLPMWIGWGVTAGGLITAGITGVLAKKADDDQAAAVGRLGVTRQELNDAKDKTHSLALATDVILIGTGVVALASTYFTIRALRWKGESSNVNVDVGLGGAGVSGRF